MLQPAVEFLLNEQVRPKTVGHKVDYIQKKLDITDEDCEEAFKRIGDTAGSKFFSNKRVATALKFLANPALKDKPGDAKVKFLTGKLKLTQEEVAEAFTQVGRRARRGTFSLPMLAERVGQVVKVEQAAAAKGALVSMGNTLNKFPEAALEVAPECAPEAGCDGA